MTIPFGAKAGGPFGGNRRPGRESSGEGNWPKESMDGHGMNPVPDSAQSPVPGEPQEMPEHTAVLLLEAGQRFLEKAEEALKDPDGRLKEYYLQKVQAILREMHRRLNHAEGGELVENLVQLYAWWGKEIAEAGQALDADRLRLVRGQMGDIRQAWEHVLFKGQGLSELPRL